MSSLRQRLTACAVVFILSSAGAAAAQEYRGSIAGTVTDVSSGVLPGVTVTVTNADTGVVQRVITDGKGFYQVLYLNAGTYSVTAELDGFKKVVQSENIVRVGDVLRVDLAMSVGAIEEMITVVSPPVVLNVTTGITGTRVDSKQIAA